MCFRTLGGLNHSLLCHLLARGRDGFPWSRKLGGGSQLVVGRTETSSWVVGGTRTTFFRWVWLVADNVWWLGLESDGKILSGKLVLNGILREEEEKDAELCRFILSFVNRCVVR